MPERFDLYSDAFVVTNNQWGVSLSFQLQQAHPAPATPPQPTDLGTIRMSNEHLKAMTFILRRQMLRHEEESGIQYNVPTAILSQLGIAKEDWDVFWSREGS